MIAEGDLVRLFKRKFGEIRAGGETATQNEANRR
jgi:hypothetical protein